MCVCLCEQKPMFRNAEALDQAIDYKRDLGYEPRKKKCFGMASLYVEQCMHIRVYIVEHIYIYIYVYIHYM